MKLAAAKLPVTTEMINRETAPRVGFTEAPVLNVSRKVITAGEHAAALSQLKALQTPVEEATV